MILIKVSGLLNMGKYNDRILAEFCPPRKWKLGRDLSYTTKDLTADDIKSLKGVGIKIKRDTNKTETITVPTGFETDLASVPRALWAFIAPFDVARAAMFLASDMAAFVTGAFLVVDGGILVQPLEGYIPPTAV